MSQVGNYQSGFVPTELEKRKEPYYIMIGMAYVQSLKEERSEQEKEQYKKLIENLIKDLNDIPSSDNS